MKLLKLMLIWKGTENNERQRMKTKSEMKTIKNENNENNRKRKIQEKKWKANCKQWKEMSNNGDNVKQWKKNEQTMKR